MIETIKLDVKAISYVPHLSQWCGPWAMLPDQVMIMSEMIRGMDITAHLASADIEARSRRDDDDESYGFYTELIEGIAHVRASGPLMKHMSSFSSSTSTVLMRRDIRKAAADPNVRGILLSLDSPGGTVAGTRELAQEVAAAAAVKPVHGFAEDMAASAAYWVISQTARLSSNATALVGSIGTYTVIHDLSAMAAQQGIKVHVVRAGDYKGAGTPGTEVTPAQIAEMQRTIDALNAHFLQGVETGRKMTSEMVKLLNDGRVHVGSAALDLKLIDAVGTYDDAVSALQAAITSPSTRRSFSMSATDPKAGDQTDQPKTEAPATPVATTPSAEPPKGGTPAQPDAREELKRYMSDFGTEAGAKYFADGLDYSAAQGAHIKSLTSQLEAANKARVEAEQKLASMNTGESSPVDTGKPASGKGAKGFESLFKQANAKSE